MIIACGAKRSRALPIPGVDAIGVLGGVDFLRDVALGKDVSLGQRVIVADRREVVNAEIRVLDWGEVVLLISGDQDTASIRLSNLPLDETGEAQARATAERIAAGPRPAETRRRDTPWRYARGRPRRRDRGYGRRSDDQCRR